MSTEQSSLSQNVESLAKDFDFRPYLDAVIKSSERTRSVIYLIVVTSIVILTSYRNHVSPSWINTRLANLQIARSCLKSNNKTEPCHKAIELASKHLFKTGFFQKNWTAPFQKVPSSDQNSIRNEITDVEFSSEITEQINNLLKKRTEQLNISLPIVGVQIDVNDLGIIGGGIFIILIFILFTCMNREILNLTAANIIAPDYRSRTLLLMSQVLSFPPQNYKKTHYIPSFALLSLPAIVNGFIVFWDLSTIDIAVDLADFTGSFETYVELFFELIIAIATFFLFKKWIDINKKLDLIIFLRDKDENYINLKELQEKYFKELKEKQNPSIADLNQV